MTPAPAPVLLPPAGFDHFYAGGRRIAALRGVQVHPRRPEEWLASTTTRSGEAPHGLTRLPDGTLLADRVLADPDAWLGAAHVARYGGAGVELLVKLLDAGQRLPVHVHPDRAFAGRHLGLAHGKTEAWVVLDADPGAVVGLGLRTPLDRAEVARLVRTEDSAALVAAVLTREVRPGDGVLVPAGTPHFIGAGVFVAEVQEPTDLSILLEWDGLAVDGTRDGHLGLGFDVALDALDLTVWTAADLDRHVLPATTADRPAGPGLRRALPPEADPYFRADHLVTSRRSAPVGVPAGFAVLVVLDGAGELCPADGAPLLVRQGDVAVVPFAAGDWTVGGGLTAVLCRPPAPDASPAPR
ncbi:MAG TPA: class I mannose-6-phosphate isomerase [Kineosporiaceae bacterium]|jgi:mannose-6-phosphate isomerase|nr:class I mannose-6-phosphate isomerase [Kineosporiaceae bacterium]